MRAKFKKKSAEKAKKQNFTIFEIYIFGSIIFGFEYLASNAAIVEVMKGVEQPFVKKYLNDLHKIKPLAVQPSSWPSCGKAVFELTGKGVKGKCMAPSNNHCSGWAEPISLRWYISLGEGSL